MRRLALLVIIFSHIVFAQARSQESAPYLYYYSQTENAFVVERADGTDRQLFAQKITQEQANEIHFRGPGWSPDGKWFAWITTYYADQLIYRNGHVVSTDGQQALSVFGHIENVHEMYWSPNSQYLLLNLSPTCRSVRNDCPTDTYWLVDVVEDSILAIFDIGQERAPIGVEWAIQNGEVDLYIWEGAWNQSPDIAYHRITLHTDGRVEKQPIPREEYQANIIPDPALSTETIFSSPDGDYSVITDKAPGFIQNNADNTAVQIPIFTFNSRNSMIPVNAQWSADSEWILGGFSDHNGLYAIGVFKRDGSEARELTACGSSSACAGWLPENVDVSVIVG